MTDDKSQISTKELIKTINASPITDEDKAHWLEMLPRLSDDHKKRLSHSLNAKIDIALAKDAIDKALSIIDNAEAEAEADLDKTSDNTASANDSITDDLEIDNDKSDDKTEPNKANIVTTKQLEESRNQADVKLQGLRQELAQISQEAGGITPPSYQQQ